MKLFKSLAVILLTACLLLACSPDPEGDRTAAPSAEPIVIGAILPLSGKSAAYGNWIREALELAREETNAEGGIGGAPLEIIYEDDEGKPSVAANAMIKLATVDRVPLVYGSWVSGSVLAMAPIANRNQVVIMAEAIAPKIRDAGDYVFRYNVDARDALAPITPFVLARGEQQVAILYINNDFGFDQAAVFEKGIVAEGGRVVFKEGYDPEATDFRTTLAKIKASQPDAVFLPGYLEVAIILRQARELGLDAQFYSSFPFENENILDRAGAATEGVIYPFFFDAESTNPIMVDFQQRYTARYGRPSEGFAALAYGGISIVVDVLREVGPHGEKIKDKLYEIRDYESPFGPVSFDEKGDVSIPVLIKTVRQGKFVVHSDAANAEGGG